MKQLSFSHINLEKPKSYSDFVSKTAKLINRSYPATLKMVESWEPSDLANIYDDCVTKWRSRGFSSPSHMWWVERGNKIGKKWKQ